MSNVEEQKAILKFSVKHFKENKAGREETTELSTDAVYKVIEALETLLADHDRLIKENEELKSKISNVKKTFNLTNKYKNKTDAGGKL